MCSVDAWENGIVSSFELLLDSTPLMGSKEMISIKNALTVFSLFFFCPQSLVALVFVSGVSSG